MTKPTLKKCKFLPTMKECRTLLEHQGWKFLKIQSVIVFSTPNGKKTRMYRLNHYNRGSFLASTRKLKLYVAEQIELQEWAYPYNWRTI